LSSSVGAQWTATEKTIPREPNATSDRLLEIRLVNQSEAITAIESPFCNPQEQYSVSSLL
jgi:hypothetical protein